MSMHFVTREMAQKLADEKNITLMEAKKQLSWELRMSPADGYQMVWDKDGFFLGTEKIGESNPLWADIRR